jgi:hypothetical protein
MNVTTLGRCPDCGESTPIRSVRGQPAEILGHGCRARACESSGCLITRLPDEMIQLPDGEWHCLSHGLLAAGRTLVARYKVDRGPDWTGIARIIEETLPKILDRFPA